MMRIADIRLGGPLVIGNESHAEGRLAALHDLFWSQIRLGVVLATRFCHGGCKRALGRLFVKYSYLRILIR